MLWLEFRAGRNPLGNGDVDVRTLTIYNDTDGVDRRPSQSPRERGRRCQLGEPQMEYEVEGATSQSPRERGRRCQSRCSRPCMMPFSWRRNPLGNGDVDVSWVLGSLGLGRVLESQSPRERGRRCQTLSNGSPRWTPSWCRNPLGNGDVDVKGTRIVGYKMSFVVSQSPRERGRRCQLGAGVRWG